MSAWDHLGKQFGEVKPDTVDQGGSYPAIDWFSGAASKYLGRAIPCKSCGSEVKMHWGGGVVHASGNTDHEAVEGKLSHQDSALEKVINSRKLSAKDLADDGTYN